MMDFSYALTVDGATITSSQGSYSRSGYCWTDSGLVNSYSESGKTLYNRVSSCAYSIVTTSYVCCNRSDTFTSSYGAYDYTMSWSEPYTGYKFSKCIADYYRSSSSGYCDGTSTSTLTSSFSSCCSPCPTHSASGVGGSSSAGTTSNTNCYIPSGTSWSFSDILGSGTEEFTSNCYYK